MCPHTVNAAAARSWHCMRSASVLPTRPACRLPRSVPAPVATATTRARARHGHNQPEAADPTSVLNLIALSWESWLIRPPDTREIPSSSLGESTPPLDLSESFCPLFFFLTAARSAFLVVARPGSPKIESSVPPWPPGSFLCAAITGSQGGRLKESGFSFCFHTTSRFVVALFFFRTATADKLGP